MDQWKRSLYAGESGCGGGSSGSGFGNVQWVPRTSLDISKAIAMPLNLKQWENVLEPYSHSF
ncbi:hypothetical protein [Moorena sp. SIO3I8]|uniref:hypothetical protein n=1 Tax=Moorena sp. SIO3I8 TaxID=2607833 RepID=UPI0013C28D68|nr:hypothetical protein [Moorena sp. SIO3I8]NEO08439.1 hypothetical protein [Moorena sp. SIO3I8]